MSGVVLCSLFLLPSRMLVGGPMMEAGEGVKEKRMLRPGVLVILV